MRALGYTDAKSAGAERRTDTRRDDQDAPVRADEPAPAHGDPAEGELRSGELQQQVTELDDVRAAVNADIDDARATVTTEFDGAVAGLKETITGPIDRHAAGQFDTARRSGDRPGQAADIAGVPGPDDGDSSVVGADRFSEPEATRDEPADTEATELKRESVPDTKAIADAVTAELVPKLTEQLVPTIREQVIAELEPELRQKVRAEMEPTIREEIEAKVRAEFEKQYGAKPDALDAQPSGPEIGAERPVDKNRRDEPRPEVTDAGRNDVDGRTLSNDEVSDRQQVEKRFRFIPEDRDLSLISAHVSYASFAVGHFLPPATQAVAWAGASVGYAISAVQWLRGKSKKNAD